MINEILTNDFKKFCILLKELEQLEDFELLIIRNFIKKEIKLRCETNITN